MIGISLRNIDNVEINNTHSFLKKYQDLVQTIRKHSKAPIILGGSGFTIFPGKMMELLKADYGIIGEGERLSLLLDHLESGETILDLPGLITVGTQEVFPPPLGTPFKKTGTADRIAQFYITHGGMLNLQTKRGCPYQCIYCTYPHIEGTKLRQISADEVADHAWELEQAGAKYLFITDSVFNSSYTHSLEVARALARKRISLPWGAFLAPTKPPKNYYRILREAGMTHAAALDAELHVAHYILLGGPGENRETLRETLSNTEKLTKTVLFFFCGIRIYPHTKIYDLTLQEGQIAESDDLLEPVFYQSRFIESQEIFRLVQEHAKGRENWIIGSGGKTAARSLARLHHQGYSGPLWERMVR